jgi:hypothetical protein
VSEIETDVGYHPILYPILKLISVVAVPDIAAGIPILVPILTPILGMQCTISVTE